MYWVVLKRLYERRVMADPDQEGFSTVPRFSHSPSNSFLTMRDPGTNTMRGSVHTPGGESRPTSFFLQRSEWDWAVRKKKKQKKFIFASCRKGRGMGDQIFSIHWIMEKARTFQKNIYFCFTDYFKPFDGVDQNKLWKSLKEVGVPDTSPVSWETCMQVKKQQFRIRHRTDGLVPNWEKRMTSLYVVTLLM